MEFVLKVIKESELRHLFRKPTTIILNYHIENYTDCKTDYCILVVV